MNDSGVNVYPKFRAVSFDLGSTISLDILAAKDVLVFISKTSNNLWCLEMGIQKSNYIFEK